MISRAVVGVLALALALGGAGCGKSNTAKRHDAVTRYIDSIDQIETKLAVPLLAISKANRDFAQHTSDPATIARKLRVAATKVDALQRQLVAIDPPPDAAKLQPLLVELTRREASLARETAALALFQPAFAKALHPLAAAGKVLKPALNSKAKPGVKATALDTYAAAIGSVLDQLGRLQTPAVLSPLFRSQRATLDQVRASASALAAGLRDKHPKNLASLLHAFNAAAVANQSLAAQRAQIQGIRAYNLRIRSIDTLSVRVHREQIRLQHLLG